jgi:glycosyltransferase involved in cell wall biosynthesis
MPKEFCTIARLVRHSNIELIQAVGAHHPHGLVIAALTRRPLVWQLHSNILWPWLRPVVGKVVGLSSASIMTNGKGIARAFNLDTVGEGQPTIFYAAMEPADFSPSKEKRQTARQELGYSANHVVIGTVGNRVWQKNHELLVQVAERLAPRQPDARICIMGAVNPGYDAAYRADVVESAVALNKTRPGLVKFVDPGEKVSELIHALDIVVFTSHSEGIPVALFEAMSAAKPVVSVDVGSIGEIITDETGVVVPSHEPDAFVSKLEPLVGSQELRERLGRSGRALILTRFTMDRVVAAHIEAYEKASRAD